MEIKDHCEIQLMYFFYSREGGMAVAATADFSVIIMDATTLRASFGYGWL